MILVTFNGMRLCKDNAWRVFANYGTYSSCVKIYKSEAAARHRAKRNGGTVVRIPDGMEIDAAGQIIETIDGKVKIRRLEEFTIYDPKKEQA